MTRHRR